MEVIGSYQSLRQARKIQDALAKEGGDWLVIGYNEHSVIYGKNGQELHIVKRGERVWDVVKREKMSEKVS